MRKAENNEKKKILAADIVSALGTAVLLVCYAVNYISRSPRLAAAELAAVIMVLVFSVFYSKAFSLHGIFACLSAEISFVALIPFTWLSAFPNVPEYTGDRFNVLLSYRTSMLLALSLIATVFITLIMPRTILQEKSEEEKLQGKNLKQLFGLSETVICICALICFVLGIILPKYFYAFNFGLQSLMFMLLCRIFCKAEKRAEHDRKYYIVNTVLFVILFIRALYLYLTMAVY